MCRVLNYHAIKTNVRDELPSSSHSSPHHSMVMSGLLQVSVLLLRGNRASSTHRMQGAEWGSTKPVWALRVTEKKNQTPLPGMEWHAPRSVITLPTEPLRLGMVAYCY